MTVDRINRRLVPIRLIDQDTPEDLGDSEIYADELGKIHLIQVEHDVPADNVLQGAIELGLEKAKRGERS